MKKIQIPPAAGPLPGDRLRTSRGFLRRNPDQKQRGRCDHGKGKNVRTEGNVNGEESRDRAVRIGSLWNRTAEDGRNYKSGVVDFGPLGELHVVLFREEKKNADGDDENE